MKYSKNSVNNSRIILQNNSAASKICKYWNIICIFRLLGRSGNIIGSIRRKLSIAFDYWNRWKRVICQSSGHNRQRLRKTWTIHRKSRNELLLVIKYRVFIEEFSDRLDILRRGEERKHAQGSVNTAVQFFPHEECVFKSRSSHISSFS